MDLFLYQPALDMLVAVGTSDTPMGRAQRALGLDRLPVGGGGLLARAFRSGARHLTGRADLDPEELRAVVDELGVRSELLVPLDRARGVLAVVSAVEDRFDAGDLTFAVAAAGCSCSTAWSWTSGRRRVGRSSGRSARRARSWRA